MVISLKSDELNRYMNDKLADIRFDLTNNQFQVVCYDAGISEFTPVLVKYFICYTAANEFKDMWVRTLTGPSH